jgi:hypothetical protein
MRISTTASSSDNLAAAETPLLERLSPIPTFDHDDEIPRRPVPEKSLLPLSSPGTSPHPSGKFVRAFTPPAGWWLNTRHRIRVGHFHYVPGIPDGSGSPGTAQYCPPWV